MLNSLKPFIIVLFSLAIVACSSAPPKNTDDICQIFKEKKSWYKKAAKAEKKWGSPIAVMMAFIHQESRFVHDVKPPRKYYLGFIPGPRPSTSYGYTQAKNDIWRDYQRATGRYRDKRTDIGDSLMFIGWYNDVSNQRNKIAKTDSYHLYLAYHEGQGGFSRASYKQKKWLLPVAQKVANQAQKYQSQLAKCEAKIKKRRW